MSPVVDVQPPARLLDPGTGADDAYQRGQREPAESEGSASSYRAGDTCHLDVADRFGNMVSATPSGGWLQCSPVIPGLGFCLGTRAQMFTLTPGCPPPSRRASDRGPRSPRAWRSATASRTSRSARPAATSRISGRSCSCSTTSLRHEPAAGDRRCVVPRRPLAVVVLIRVRRSPAPSVELRTAAGCLRSSATAATR